MKASIQKLTMKFLISVIFLSGLIGLVQAESAQAGQNNTNSKAVAYSDRDNAVTQVSENGEYRFTLFTTDATFPFQKIHNWIIHIENKDGTPVENAKVFVFGGMPVHQHSFPTKPKVKKYLGDGDYLVEGIKFNMPGEWEMRFNIKNDNKRSRAVFKINLSHQVTKL